MPEDFSVPQPADPVDTITTYLRDENEVLRCSAVRALCGFSDGTVDLKPVLSRALLDPDPDVRSDAMEVFAGIAESEDAETLRASLEGDPVREVKLAAIRGLGRLKDAASNDLLRGLVLSRCEERVAWEDEDSDWEDWLDIQVAAIDALGETGCTEALPDLLAARDDEMGQTLDGPVFRALSKLGDEGIAYLLAIFETEHGRPPRRAVACLATLAPERLAPYLATLLASHEASLRSLAIGLLPPDAMELAQIVASDTDIGVRCAALERAASAQPGLVLEALRMDEAQLQATALGQLVLPLPPEIETALADNMIAWLATAPPVLMTAAATRLPDIAPDRAVEPLLALALDRARPLEARVAAVRSLAKASPLPTADVSELLATPSQQVRMAALTVLNDAAEQADSIAIDALARAIDGSLLPEGSSSAEDLGSGTHDFATPKGEFEGGRRIRITPEGEIVDLAPEEGVEEGSTLASILKQAEPVQAPQAEDTPEEGPGKRRKRRAVEGPDDVQGSLAREALQTAGGLDHDQIRQAVLGHLADPEETMRQAAWRAVEKNLGAFGALEDAQAAAKVAIKDEEPVVRLAAYRLLCRACGHESIHDLAQADADPLIRAEAVGWMPLSEVQAKLCDDAQPVRSAATRRILEQGSDEMIADSVATLIAAERSDTLAQMVAGSDVTRSSALAALCDAERPKRQVLVILEAFAQLRPDPA